MKLTIGQKEYELKFGLKFLRELDKAYVQKIEGMEFSMGLQQANIYLNMKHPDALNKVIKAGLSYLNSYPSNDDIESFLEETYESGKETKLLSDIQKAMEQAPFLKQQLKEMKKDQKKVQE